MIIRDCKNISDLTPTLKHLKETQTENILKSQTKIVEQF